MDAMTLVSHASTQELGFSAFLIGYITGRAGDTPSAHFVFLQLRLPIAAYDIPYRTDSSCIICTGVATPNNILNSFLQPCAPKNGRSLVLLVTLSLRFRSKGDQYRGCGVCPSVAQSSELY